MKKNICSCSEDPLPKNNIYPIAVVLSVGPYVYTEFLRLTQDEIKEHFETWERNEHTVIKASVTFDNKVYIRFKNYEDLCWLIEHKDDGLFGFFIDYRL